VLPNEERLSRPDVYPWEVRFEDAAMGRAVLAVDDDALFVEVIAKMLKSIGCEVITAHSAMDALTALEQNPRIEVLITDVQMPFMDGNEFARRAKETRPQLNVLLATGRLDDGHGFPVIHKPFRQDELATVMARTTGLC
jgi:CheY-like chemotaxis protein